jgi:hypothetical protein
VIPAIDPGPQPKDGDPKDEHAKDGHAKDGQ